jgi:hypothetical protein
MKTRKSGIKNLVTISQNVEEAHGAILRVETVDMNG